jgi:hypothetical protein
MLLLGPRRVLPQSFVARRTFRPFTKNAYRLVTGAVIPPYIDDEEIQHEAGRQYVGFFSNVLNCRE